MSQNTDLLTRDRAHVWHPFTQAATAGPPLPVVAAQGSWLTLADGRQVLDGISSWWTSLAGHCHPRLVDAVAKQARTLDHVLFAGCTHPGAVELSEKLVQRAPPGLTRVFFSDDGSTAVEVALKLAIQYHAQNGQPQRTQFLALEGGYHGDTIGAMSVGDPEDFAGPFAPLLWPVGRLPVALAEGDALTAPFNEAAWSAQLDAHFDRVGDRLAAVIAEPLIQGAGGMRLYPPAFLALLARKTRERGALLIADEVMTGFGRTGALFACQHAAVSPDLLCLAKGLTGGMLPMAVTLATDAIFARFLGNSAKHAFLHGHSFTASPMACAAALASLDVVESEDLVAKAIQLHDFYACTLPALATLPGVRSVRWLGCVGVVELSGHGYHDRTRSAAIAAYALEHGLLVRPLGPVLYTLPPLNIRLEELSRAWEILAEAIRTNP